MSLESEAMALVRGFVEWFDCNRKTAPVREARKFLSQCDSKATDEPGASVK